MTSGSDVRLGDGIPRKSERLLVASFVLVAVSARVVYWVYTGRTWEDALITMVPAQNVWDGVGLTHHASEPRVHSFTSPASVLIPVLGEAFGQGLWLLRVVSLVAAALTVVAVNRICSAMSVGLPGRIFALSFVALDHMQIYFGMGGMETQIATAALVSSFCFLITRRYTALGLALGFSLLCRPDFIIPGVIAGLWVVMTAPRQTLRVAGLAFLVYMPWLVFATWYYGSPVPNTIIAKSWSGRISPFDTPFHVALEYLRGSWREYAPIIQHFFARTTVPDAVLLSSLVMALLAGVLGAVEGSRRKFAFLAVATAMVAFVAYKAFAVRNHYYMWYQVPFLALFTTLVAVGIDAIGRRVASAAGIVVSAALTLAYVLPLPVMAYMDRQTQIFVEDGVRKKVGQTLDKLMGPGDAAVLEPLGYIGYYARNRTIYDFPGLGSKVSVAAVKDMPIPNVVSLAARLSPSHIVFRKNEYEQFIERFPGISKTYEVVSEIRHRPDAVTGTGLVSYYNHLADGHFLILERVAD